MPDPKVIADAHSARVVLAALDTEHGRAALLGRGAQNDEFIEWYRDYGQRKPWPAMTYYEYAIRRFLERLGVVDGGT